jgi:hypothetical protein
MALPLFQEGKRQQYLNWILLIVILIGGLWFARNYLVKPLPPPPSPPKKETIEINLKLLENPAFQELQPFEGINPFEGEIGRENPFLPY